MKVVYFGRTFESVFPAESLDCLLRMATRERDEFNDEEENSIEVPTKNPDEIGQAYPWLKIRVICPFWLRRRHTIRWYLALINFPTLWQKKLTYNKTSKTNWILYYQIEISNIDLAFFIVHFKYIFSKASLIYFFGKYFIEGGIFYLSKYLYIIKFKYFPICQRALVQVFQSQAICRILNRQKNCPKLLNQSQSLFHHQNYNWDQSRSLVSQVKRWKISSPNRNHSNPFS